MSPIGLNIHMDKIQYIKDNYGILSNSEISDSLGLSVNQIRSLVYKHIPFDDRYRRGKSPHSKPKRKFNVNDESFSEYNLNSCYWAGLMAADGHITKKWDSFSIGLKESDRSHIEKFKVWLNFDGPICYNKNKYLYKGVEQMKYSYSIKVTSKKIVEDLNNNFGVIRKKSLIIKPPTKIKDDQHIDSFIKGYIDGDGSLSLGKDKTSRLSILGTYDMIIWINERFENILGRHLPKPIKNGNVWKIDLGNKTSRKLLQTFFNIKTPELERKWTPELRDIVFNYKKSRNLDNYKNIIRMQSEGMNQTEISKHIGVTSAAICWIMKQDCFKILKESAARDNGEADMEEES